jgi:hypothetical protein
MVVVDDPAKLVEWHAAMKVWVPERVGEIFGYQFVRKEFTFERTSPKRLSLCSGRRGRSLRDFDLKTRMFRYPLSYFVYGEIFDNLPDVAKDAVYRRLYEVLSGKEIGPRYARLSTADRLAILEILRETKPNLPTYYLTQAPGE